MMMDGAGMQVLDAGDSSGLEFESHDGGIIKIRGRRSRELAWKLGLFKENASV